jgi:hypothetical protein
MTDVYTTLKTKFSYYPANNPYNPLTKGKVPKIERRVTEEDLETYRRNVPEAVRKRRSWWNWLHPNCLFLPCDMTIEIGPSASWNYNPITGNALVSEIDLKGKPNVNPGDKKVGTDKYLNLICYNCYFNIGIGFGMELLIVNGFKIKKFEAYVYVRLDVNIQVLARCVAKAWVQLMLPLLEKNLKPAFFYGWPSSCCLYA